ncbi:unnamed protein product [Rhizophagus irregularis]|nr:unnamed protein product [Rhizophagus irregularis]
MTNELCFAPIIRKFFQESQEKPFGPIYNYSEFKEDMKILNFITLIKIPYNNISGGRGRLHTNPMSGEDYFR